MIYGTMYSILEAKAIIKNIICRASRLERFILPLIDIPELLHDKLITWLMQFNTISIDLLIIEGRQIDDIYSKFTLNYL